MTDRSTMQEHYTKALKIASEHETIGVSGIQRGLGLGFASASRIINMLEEKKVIGPANEKGKHPVLRPEGQK